MPDSPIPPRQALFRWSREYGGGNWLSRERRHGSASRYLRFWSAPRCSWSRPHSDALALPLCPPRAKGATPRPPPDVMRGQDASGLLEISAISDTNRCASGGARRIKALRMATAGSAKSVEAGLLPDPGRRRAGAPGIQHRPLRIGIDATCWRMRRGFGRHARCLLGAMLEVDPGNEYLFFIDSDEVAGELPSDVRTRVVGPSTPSSRSGARRPRDLLRAAMAMSAAPLDVIVFRAIYSYVPVFSRARKI